MLELFRAVSQSVLNRDPAYTYSGQLSCEVFCIDGVRLKISIFQRRA